MWKMGRAYVLHIVAPTRMVVHRWGRGGKRGLDHLSTDKYLEAYGENIYKYNI